MHSGRRAHSLLTKACHHTGYTKKSLNPSQTNNICSANIPPINPHDLVTGVAATGRATSDDCAAGVAAAVAVAVVATAEAVAMVVATPGSPRLDPNPASRSSGM